MDICNSLDLSQQNTSKLFLPQSQTDHTYDTNIFQPPTYTTPPNYTIPTTNPDTITTHSHSPPPPIQWDIPLSSIGDKPDLSRIRTASTGSTVSSAFSEIQLYGPSSLGIDIDIDDDIDSINDGIFIESRALSREISMNLEQATNITENHTQDSYDSPSDSERDDTPTPHLEIQKLEPISMQKTKKIYVTTDAYENSTSKSISESTIYDYENNDISSPQIHIKYDNSYVESKSNLEVHYEQHEIKQESYDEICNEMLLKYKWQNYICNEQNYSAFYPNFQTEIMNNPFFKLSASDFNDVLKKCQFIKSRWIGEKIRSTRKGMLGKYKWNVGQKITQLDLFAIKLYTDFEICQRELKKCYRPPIDNNQSDLYEYEQRLSYFSHWRERLNVAILKYGQLLKNKVFYHGINKIMELDMHPTHRCHGPFSATSDLEIARGFATKNGFILKMTSQFPRLGTDYFFDAAPISAYPDEKEYLIGFIYTRILNVCLGCTKLTMHDLNEMTIKKLTCFIINSLIKNNLYSYGPYLELLFYALHNNQNMYNIFNEREIKQIIEISEQIPAIIKAELTKIRNKMRILKLDCISNKMKHLFYNESLTEISLNKIYQYTPNIEQLHFYENKYKMNNTFINQFLLFINQYPNIKLNTIKLFKYSFIGNSNQFNYKSQISKTNIIKLQTIGWNINEYRNTNCYKFILKKSKCKYNQMQ